MKTYPIADRPSLEEREFFGKKCLDSFHDIEAIYTGEKRCPKKGEWYLSGAIVCAYKAPHDFSTEYHIAKLVQVETKTVVTKQLIKKLD